MVPDDWKRELAEVIFGRMPIIVWTAVCVTAASVALTVVVPPAFEATGSLILRSKTVQRSTDSLNVPDERTSAPTENDLVSEQQLLLSGALIRRTIENLQASGDIDSPGDALGERKGLLSSVKSWLLRLIKGDDKDGAEAEMAGAVEATRKNALSAHVVTDSNVIGVKLKGNDAQRVERFLDTLMTEYIQYRLEVLHPPNQRLFYRERRDFYSKRLKALEDQLVAATDAASVTDLEAEIANNIDLEMTLSDRHNTLRNSYMEQEQQVATLAEALASKDVTHFAFLENDVMETLNGELMALTIERRRLQRQFLEESPQLEALNKNIADAQATLRAEVNAILQDGIRRQNTLAAQIKLLEFTLAELKDRTDALQNEAMQFRQLSREMELLRVSYESFARRSEEAEISQAVGASEASGDVTVLSRPAFSSTQVFPKVPLVPILGLLMGLAIGCVAAFGLEYFDHTVRRISDVTVCTSLPVIGSIRRVASVKPSK